MTSVVVQLGRGGYRERERGQGEWMDGLFLFLTLVT